MNDYIKRADATEAVWRILNGMGISQKHNDRLVEEVDAVLDEYPAADVVPVVRGRWIRHYEQADTGEDIITYPCGWVCSECGRWESEDEPFCNCGAMMEGEEE